MLEDVVALINDVDVAAVWLILELVDGEHLYVGTSYVSDNILLDLLLDEGSWNNYPYLILLVDKVLSEQENKEGLSSASLQFQGLLGGLPSRKLCCQKDLVLLHFALSAAFGGKLLGNLQDTVKVLFQVSRALEFAIDV